MNKINLQKGISLVETLVYVAIFSIFVASLLQFSNTLYVARLQGQDIFEVNGQGAQAVGVMTQAIRNANTLSSPEIGTSSSLLSINTTFPILFSEIDGVLYVNENGGPLIALTNNKVSVSNLTFSNFSNPGAPDSIQIRFTVSGNNYTNNFYGTATLRK